MRFKYGSSMVTAVKSKDGVVITNVVVTVGDAKLSLSDFSFSKRVDKLLGKLERKATLIFAANAKKRKAANGRV